MASEANRSLGQFFFEVGYGACFAEVMIRQDMKPPFELSDAHIEGAWPRSIEAHEDPAEIDRNLALVNAAAALLKASQTVLAGLNERIDAATVSGGSSVPVFAGIAELSDAIASATGAA